MFRHRLDRRDTTRSTHGLRRPHPRRPRGGLRQAADGDAIWCGSDAMSEHEYRALTRAAVSRFTYSLVEPQATERAVATIEEHHPGETIGMEVVARS